MLGLALIIQIKVANWSWRYGKTIKYLRG